MDQYLKNFENDVALDLKKIVEVTITEIITAQESKCCSLINFNNLYVNKRHQNLTYSIEETVKGNLKNNDVKELKLVLNELFDLHKKHTKKFVNLQKHDELSLKDFETHVERISQRKLKILTSHPFLSDSLTQIFLIEEVSSLLMDVNEHHLLRETIMIEKSNELVSMLDDFKKNYKDLYCIMREMKHSYSKPKLIRNLIRLFRNRVNINMSINNTSFCRLLYDFMKIFIFALPVSQKIINKDVSNLASLNS